MGFCLMAVVGARSDRWWRCTIFGEHIRRDARLGRECRACIRCSG